MIAGRGIWAKIAAIEDTLEDIRAGKIVIVVDDEDRENEGDFIMAAEKVTPEAINFMARHGRGLVCLPATPARLKELDLDMMVNTNTAPSLHAIHGEHRRALRRDDRHFRTGPGGNNSTICRSQIAV